MTRSAREIREEIIATVLRNGGHLASSLGAVELSMALAEAFDPERDRVVWDVGHQAYAWKILTGRGGRFGSIRTLGGLSPFLDPAESPADAAVLRNVASCIRGEQEHMTIPVSSCSFIASFIISCPA